MVGRILLGLWHLLLAVIALTFLVGYMLWWVLTGWEDDWKAAHW